MIVRTGREHRGFTLIELLVVIAIIAILAAILFPIFMTARERARQVGCLANLKQLGQALRAYCDDWNSILPFTRLWETRIMGGDPGWAGAYEESSDWFVDPRRGSLWRYVKNKGIYVCPSDRNMGPPAGKTKTWPLSYPMNGVFSWRNCETMRLLPGAPWTCNYGWWMSGTVTGYGGGLKNNKLSKLLVLVHQGKLESSLAPEYNWWDGPAYQAPATVHFDGTTLLYADWHVKWQNARATRKAILDFEWHPDR